MNSTAKIRQICVTPFTHGWYRFTAILGEVSGESRRRLGDVAKGSTVMLLFTVKRGPLPSDLNELPVLLRLSPAFQPLGSKLEKGRG